MKEIVSFAKFSERLAEIMEENNDTTYSLGEYLGVKPPTVSRYRSGIIEPKRVTITAIADKYGVNEAWLMGADVEKFIDKRTLHRSIPILSDPSNKDSIISNEYVDNDVDSDYCLIMKDDSMIGARIYKDDVLFISKQKSYDVGDIVVVCLDNNEYMVKRLYKNTNSIMLHSENPTVSDIIYSGKDRKLVKILGKVKYTKFEVR